MYPPRAIVIVFALLVALAAKAETFTPTADVDLRDQPGGARKVAKLEANQAFPLLKKGGPGGAWCKLKAGGAEGWVECAKGRAGNDRPGPATPDRDKESRKPARCATKCDREPLFDDPIELTKTDREVLALCPTTPEAAVTSAEVRRFLAAHYDDARLQRALSAAGRPGSGAGVREQNLDWLTALWFGKGPRNAFTHVFCGDEWNDGDLGGLHWLPRYAQLEDEGKLCYRGAVRGSVPRVKGQYLIRYSGLAPWSCGRKNVGGFSERHDPIEMIAAATRAFVRCCDRNGRREGGVYRAPDLGPTSWQIWCGTRNGTYGIATFYPVDSRPTCGD